MVGKKVLVVDDDEGLLQLVSLIFKKAGAQVMTANSGLDGVNKFFTYHPDLIILDVVMHDSNGFDICRRIRQVSDDPLIMLTSLNREEDMLKGLAAGADDFLSKPFSPEILLARARAVLRRSKHSNGHNESKYKVHNRDSGSLAPLNYNDGYLSIDIERHEVLKQGKRIKLTPVEFRLLVFLARNSGKLLTFEQILSNVWGNEYQGSMEHVHVYISHLRRKIEQDTKNPRYIMTIHGMGYIFEKQELGYKV